MATEEIGLREKIMESAKCLFIEHGYHGLSMREISEKVGVSKAALYYHFKDKEALFIAILNNGLDEIGKAIDLIQERSISHHEKILQFMEYVLNQPAEQRAVIRLGKQEIVQLNESAKKLFEDTYHVKFTGKLQALIQAGIENGEFRDVDPDIATWALLGMLYPYLYPGHFGSPSLSQKKIQIIIGIFMDGINLPKK